MDLKFDKDMVKLYRELAKHFVIYVSGREGLSKIVKYSELELKYMFDWNVDRSAHATQDAHAAQDENAYDEEGIAWMYQTARY